MHRLHGRKVRPRRARGPVIPRGHRANGRGEPGRRSVSQLWTIEDDLFARPHRLTPEAPITCGWRSDRVTTVADAVVLPSHVRDAGRPWACILLTAPPAFIPSPVP